MCWCDEVDAKNSENTARLFLNELSVITKRSPLLFVLVDFLGRGCCYRLSRLLLLLLTLFLLLIVVMVVMVVIVVWLSDC